MNCTQSIIDEFLQNQNNSIKQLAVPIIVLLLFLLIALLQYKFQYNVEICLLLGFNLQTSAYILNKYFCKKEVLKYSINIFIISSKFIYFTTPLLMLLPIFLVLLFGCSKSPNVNVFLANSLIYIVSTLIQMVHFCFFEENIFESVGWVFLVFSCSFTCFALCSIFKVRFQQIIKGFINTESPYCYAAANFAKPIIAHLTFIQSYIIIKICVLIFAFYTIFYFENDVRNLPSIDKTMNLASFLELCFFIINRFHKVLLKIPGVIDPIEQVILDYLETPRTARMNLTNSDLIEYYFSSRDEVENLYSEKVTVIWLFSLFGLYRFLLWHSFEATSSLGVVIRSCAYVLNNCVANKGKVKVFIDILMMTSCSIYVTTPFFTLFPIISIFLTNNFKCMKRHVWQINSVVHFGSTMCLIMTFFQPDNENPDNYFPVVTFCVYWVFGFLVATALRVTPDQVMGEVNEITTDPNAELALKYLKSLKGHLGFCQIYMTFKFGSFIYLLCFTVNNQSNKDFSRLDNCMSIAAIVELMFLVISKLILHKYNYFYAPASKDDIMGYTFLWKLRKESEDARIKAFKRL
ncbi:unnamed protein product [Caenorhabditis angaria]|uniref:Uncharacterized protein n=1 Tax=Caenorhabditis angaria TaxID=860376 RepID=A0A9P1NAV4_9PELO|nr:unnamed protein product [Caenorhabditis angaria]